MAAERTGLSRFVNIHERAQALDEPYRKPSLSNTMVGQRSLRILSDGSGIIHLTSCTDCRMSHQQFIPIYSNLNCYKLSYFVVP